MIVSSTACRSGLVLLPSCDSRLFVASRSGPAPVPITVRSTRVLGRVKGALATLGGSAALDPACAPWSSPSVATGTGASGGAPITGWQALRPPSPFRRLRRLLSALAAAPTVRGTSFHKSLPKPRSWAVSLS
jgi:hypothetical protein